MTTSHEDFTFSSCGIFVSVEHPFLDASPDALIQCICCGQGIVEIKCPLCVSETSLQEAADGVRNLCLKELTTYELQQRHDHGYYYQCQLQMFVTRRLFCDFVVWSPKETHI